MNVAVDLNADLGEGAASEEELLTLVTSANIACGFHAGSPESMRASILAAQKAGVKVGAHPSLADRENFGRRELPVGPNEVFSLVAYQLGAFQAIARKRACTSSGRSAFVKATPRRLTGFRLRRAAE